SVSAQSRGLAPSWFQHFVDISLQMVQALLLVHFGQLVRLVALAAVGYHNPGVVGGNQFPYFLISMLIPNLVHPGLVGVKSHPMCSLPVNAPARVIGIGYRRLGHSRSQLLVGISDCTRGLFQRILSEGALC